MQAEAKGAIFSLNCFHKLNKFVKEETIICQTILKWDLLSCSVLEGLRLKSRFGLDQVTGQ